MNNPLVIDANPTKDFFITMLTRDIPLDRAIIDLIDNSVDAAYSDKVKKQKTSLEGYQIDIKINDSYFEITDNCGGFSLETAQKHAFRFGRDNTAPPTPKSVGQFGVGMKRTLFKLGNKFLVSSRTTIDDGFKVEVDVSEWKSNSNKKWEFPCSINNNDIEVGHTKILVSELSTEISEQFAIDEFIDSLASEISLAHFISLHEKLSITINGKNVPKYEISLFQNEDFNPIIFEDTFDNEVKIKIIAGLSERIFEKGGWYIVCNGRLILDADQSKITGWDKDLGSRKYHADLAFFRGIVQFESVNSGLLPWTTTKTGIDTDNKYYKIALKEMLNIMKTILPKLTQRAEEASNFKQGLVDSQNLTEKLENAKVISFFKINEKVKEFKIPSPNLNSSDPKEIKIQYSVALEKFNKVSEMLGTQVKAEVGSLTFNYYFDYECSDE